MSATLPYDRIEAKREALGLSARELCRRADLNETTLANAKRNGGGLDSGTIVAFAAALGCPVSELLGEESAPALAAASGVQLLDLGQLVASPLNPRRTFEEEPLHELANSIAVHGLLQNLTVRPSGHATTGGKPGYWIVAGERRFRAVMILAQEDRLPETLRDGIPCRVIEADDATHLALSLLENLQRKDVNPMEEANAFARLTGLGWTTAQIAEKIGTTQRHIQQRIALTQRLAPACQEALQKGTINFTQARIILAAPPKKQVDLLKNIANGDTTERLRSRVTGEMIPFAHAIFPREAYLGEIVEGDDGTEYATDKEAFLAAQRAAIAKRKANLEASGLSVACEERGWSFIVGDYAHPAHDGSEAARVTVLWLDTRTGEATEHPDRMRRPERGDTAEEAATRAEREAKLAAQNAEFEAFAKALRTKVAARYDVATALLLMSFDRGMAWRDEDRPPLTMNRADRLSREKVDWKRSLNQALKVSTHDVAKIIAAHLNCDRWTFPHALIAAADLLGVAVPAWMRPEPEANAVRDPDDDAEPALPLDDDDPDDDEGEFASALDDLAENDDAEDDPIAAVEPWSRPFSTTCPDDAA